MADTESKVFFIACQRLERDPSVVSEAFVDFEDSAEIDVAFADDESVFFIFEFADMGVFYAVYYFPAQFERLPCGHVCGIEVDFESIIADELEDSREVFEVGAYAPVIFVGEGDLVFFGVIEAGSQGV